MHLAPAILSALTVFILSVEGKKTKVVHRVNSQHVHAWRYWKTDGCEDFNTIVVFTNNGAFKELGSPDISNLPLSVHIYGGYYHNCANGQAMKTDIDCNSEFSAFPGLYHVNGLKRADVATDADARVVDYDCTLVNSKYECQEVGVSTLPLSFAHTILTGGKKYVDRDNSVLRLPGYVLQNDTISSCKGIASATFDVVVNGEMWEYGDAYNDYGHICTYKGSYTEIYTV
jgi:hypothetical protein